MRNYPFLKLLGSLLLAVVLNPGYAQNQSDSGIWFMNSLRDKAGNLWFGTTTQGIYRYEAATGTFTHLTRDQGLCSNNIADVFEDRNGTFWIATDKGICRSEGSRFISVTTEQGPCSRLVTCIAEDTRGELWFGTMGYGSFRYNPATGVFTPYTKEQGMWSNSIQCITRDKTGNLWFGERDGGVSRYDAASDRFVRVNGKGCLSSQIMNITEDRTGDLWFANLYEGVCRYRPGSETFTSVTEKEGLCGDVVTCLYEDQKGNMWISSGTNTPGIIRSVPGGICRYDGSTFTRFGTGDAFRNQNVWTILEDKDANLWVGTKGGLFRYHAPSGRFVEFTHKLEK